MDASKQPTADIAVLAARLHAAVENGANVEFIARELQDYKNSLQEHYNRLPGNGWIPWFGEQEYPPYPLDTKVYYQFTDGEIVTTPERIDALLWKRNGDSSKGSWQIAAYKLVR